MGKHKFAVEFSLDCEKIWGMREGVPEGYLLSNVVRADASLDQIVEKWNHGPLHLVFVLKALPCSQVTRADEALLEARGYAGFTSGRFTQYCSFDPGCLPPNIKFGLHGVCHRLYSGLDTQLLSSEASEIIGFAKKNNRYAGMFVYPKNIIDSRSIMQYSQVFEKIRVNSRSWLYRTSFTGLGVIRRALRYLDSFLPIYELFCDKRPEHDLENVTVGTHFFRANLPACFLVLHYIRIQFGIAIMRVIGVNVHVWSHPHNFNGRGLAISLFVSLAGRSSPGLKAIGKI